VRNVPDSVSEVSKALAEVDYLADEPAALVSFLAQRLGKPILVNGKTLTIIGVTPEGFEGTTLGRRPKLYIPLSMATAVDPKIGPPEGMDDRRKESAVHRESVQQHHRGTAACALDVQRQWTNLRAVRPRAIRARERPFALIGQTSAPCAPVQFALGSGPQHSCRAIAERIDQAVDVVVGVRGRQRHAQARRSRRQRTAANQPQRSIGRSGPSFDQASP
jgi:hypothetical protein